MSSQEKQFVPGSLLETKAQEIPGEIDGYESLFAIHCPSGLLMRLMQHATRFKEREVFGLLLGRAVRTPSNRLRTLVLDFLPAQHFAASSPAYVEVSPEELIRLDRLYEESADTRDLLKVGWFHTHPNHGIFMSSTDKENHSLYQKPWQVALVLDPVRGESGFFAGTGCVRVLNVIDPEATPNGTKIPSAEPGDGKSKSKEVSTRDYLWYLIVILFMCQIVFGILAFVAFSTMTSTNDKLSEQGDKLFQLERKVGRIVSDLKKTRTEPTPPN